ncbi:manganese containing catalase [Schinkia azotoformans LMG 9581]|uniref:Manganese containing catalase n=2 Tax=Schinkia azotoformans TaxID=1454 RepID=K6E2H3_SCHAZ|nr:manganese containing catalase [Schinkia azotoformans LMG 9581]
MKACGLGAHYADHDKALYYHNAAGAPFTITYVTAKGDPITDLYEDIAAEEKARATYQWLINLSDDPDINDALRFLREREIIHSLRFQEAVEILKEERDKKVYF